MKVLLISDQPSLLSSFRQQCSERIEPITQLPISLKAIGETIDLSAMLHNQQPDFIICAAVLPLTASEQDLEHYRVIIENCVEYSVAFQAGLLFLSTAAVFPQGKIHYSEEDQCQPLTTLAEFYHQQELYIEHALQRFLILRTSWLYSSDEENFLTAVLQSVMSEQLISFNSAGKGCPTSVHDVARVLLAILLQLDEGAEAWGTFHYASSDAAIGFQFVEAIMAYASQYAERVDARHLQFEHNDKAIDQFYFEPIVLNCQKLLDHFGIHQKPWRALMADVVKEYFAEESI